MSSHRVHDKSRVINAVVRAMASRHNDDVLVAVEAVVRDEAALQRPLPGMVSVLEVFSPDVSQTHQPAKNI
jgi:hypothetical protein